EPTPAAAPTPPAAPAPPTLSVPPVPSTGVVEGLTETLVGGTPTPGSPTGTTPSTGVLGGVGEALEDPTGTRAGQPAGEVVDRTTDGARELLGGVLRGPGDRTGQTP